MGYMRDWRAARLDSFDAARDLPGCWGYYDASTLGLANGAAVKQWGDLSGGGNGLSQTTSAARPTYNAAGQNGLGTVTFSASQWMTSFVGGPSTWAFVTTQVQGTSAATGAIILGASGTTGLNPLDGDIAEAGMFNADLSAKQIEYLCRHLATKWGL
jgi:hypothetical protein